MEDIYQTFNKNLYKITDKETSNPLDGYLGGSTLVNSDGSFDFANVKIGVNRIFVPVGGNIQQALDSLNQKGGGTVFLQTGTHTVTSSLTLYNNISGLWQADETKTITGNVYNESTVV